MTGPRILAVHTMPDRTNHLHSWLEDAGAELTTLSMNDDALPDAVDGYDALVTSGAGDDPREVRFTGLRTLLSGAVSAQVPVLAVGLGAQLLALATGGGVRPADRGPAAGPALVAKRDTGTQDPLFADLPLSPDVLQFHGDEIHPLPPTAQLLASSPRYANQAFRVGKCAYGLQFHIGTSPEHVLTWAERNPEVAAGARAGGLDYERLSEAHQEMEEAWRPFGQRFVELADGRLSGSLAPGNPLPLV